MNTRADQSASGRPARDGRRPPYGNPGRFAQPVGRARPGARPVTGECSPRAAATADPAAWSPRVPVGLLAGLLLIAACAPQKAAEPAKKPEAPPVAVTVAEATARDVPVQLFAIGAVKASASVQVKSQQKGQLQKTGFKEGDEVKAGDLLFTVDARPYDAALDQAKANLARDRALLARAESDLKRAAELQKSDSIAQSAFDQFQSSVDALKATIAADTAAAENTQVQRDYCFIRSPISGRIGALLVDEGNMVRDIDTVLAVINQLKPIYVDFSVPEQHLPEVREHRTAGPLRVTATFPQRSDLHAEGELTLINNEVDRATGTIMLRATFPNTDEILWPGQYVNVALTLALRTNAVTVPADAVQLGQLGSFVFLAKADQTVETRPIVAGLTIDRSVVVEKGLEAGERVVTSGQLRLKPGARYEVRKTDPGDGAAPPKP
jgi:membrane fusion protein, multidrug efflux system